MALHPIRVTDKPSNCRFPAIWLYAICAGLLSMLLGCSGGSGSSETDPTTVPTVRVLGMVRTSAPIAAMSLSFYAGAEERDKQVEGTPLGTATSNKNGNFLSSAMPGSSFRVTASGGTVNGQAIKGVLRAHVRDYKHGQPLYINAVTTLVSAYLDATPGITLAEAEATVGKFLNLSGARHGSGYVPYDGDAFSHVEFEKELAAYKDFNAFMDQLVAEVKASASSHTFAGNKSIAFTARRDVLSANNTQSDGDRKTILEGGIASSVLVSLVNGALGKTGGVLFGPVLTALGLGDSTPNYTAQFQAITNAIENIQSGIHTLHNQVAAVNQNVLQGTYQTIASNNNSLFAAIDANYANLAFLAGVTQAEYAAEKAYYDNLKNTYQANLATVINSGVSQLTLYQAFTGTVAGSQSVPRVISQALLATHYFYNSTSQQQLFSVTDYWQTKQIALFGLTLTQLQVTAAPQNVVTNAVNLFCGTLTSTQVTTPGGPTGLPAVTVTVSAPQAGSQLALEQAMLPNRLPLNTFYDTRSGLLIATAPYTSYYLTPAVAAQNGAISNNLQTQVSNLPTGWRLPTQAEAGTIFNGWNGATVADWAISQGWPSNNNMVAGNMVAGNAGGIVMALTLTIPNLPTDSANFASGNAFSFSNGSISSLSSGLSIHKEVYTRTGYDSGASLVTGPTNFCKGLWDNWSNGGGGDGSTAYDYFADVIWDRGPCEVKQCNIYTTGFLGMGSGGWNQSLISCGTVTSYTEGWVADRANLVPVRPLATGEFYVVN